MCPGSNLASTVLPAGNVTGNIARFYSTRTTQKYDAYLDVRRLFSVILPECDDQHCQSRYSYLPLRLSTTATASRDESGPNAQKSVE